MVASKREQQAPAGYKHTEIGVIPKDWELVTFDEAFVFLRTASYSRDKLGSTGEVKYIHYGDIHTKWSHFVNMSRSSIPTVGREMIANYSQMKDGDLVIADASEDYEGIGKSVEVSNLSLQKAIAGLHTFLLRDKDYHFVDGFKGYICSNPLVKPSLDRYATGLKVYGISKNNLKLVQIPKPSIVEQSAIVTALRNTEALIESLEKLIAKKRAIKQGAMQELLTGKRRLMGFQGEWKERRLTEIADIDPENLSSRTSPEYSFKYISLEDVNNGILQGYSNQVFRTAPSRARRKLKQYDILISTVRPNLKSHLLVRNDVTDTVCSTGFSVVRCKSNLADPAFVYAHLFAGGIERQIESMLTGSNYPAINSKEVKALRIPCPELPEQSAIAVVLSDMDAEIEGLEQKLSKTRLIELGMMQVLLTGKIRLPSK